MLQLGRQPPQEGFTSKSNCTRVWHPYCSMFIYKNASIGAPTPPRGFYLKIELYESLASQLKHFYIKTLNSNFKAKVMNPRLYFGRKRGRGRQPPQRVLPQNRIVPDIGIPIEAFLYINIKL